MPRRDGRLAALLAAVAVLASGCCPAHPPREGADPDAGSGSGPGRIVLSEVVLSPVNDWSGGALPFDELPGDGAINQNDEFVELANVGGEPVDLTGWTLEIVDVSPATSQLGVDGELVFDPGSSLTALQPGGLAVLGNPAQIASTDAYLLLRDAAGEVVDDVEIGGLSAARDFEGDGLGDGAPSPVENGFARGSFDEAIARLAGADDTDDDQADFVAMVATPLAPNVAPAVTPEIVAPTIAEVTISSDLAVSAPIEITADEPLDHASVDEPGVLTASVGGTPIALGFHTYEDGDRTVVLNPIGRWPFDVDLVVTLKGGGSGARDRAGNPLAADLVFSVHTEAAPTDPGAVLLNEICVAPRQDWSDSEGGNGIPFDEVPGVAEVRSEDEWLELRVGGVAPVDLTSYAVVMYVGPSLLQPPRATTTLGAADHVIVRGIGSLAAAAPGDLVVVGDPAGSLASSVWLEVRDGDGVLIDAVEIGGLTPETDRGGDGVDDGAPGPGQDGSSTSLADEVVARRPGSVDTGDEADDFDHASATLGAAN